MAFDSDIVSIHNSGSVTFVTGTFENTAGSTGGDINTGLKSVRFISLQHSGAAVVASAPSVNETLPCAGNAVTVVTTADADGYWAAWGF